jgi:cytochrome c
MRHPITAFLMLSAALSTSAPTLAAGEAERGKTLYAAKCAACHSLEYNGVGPAHRGVFERKAGVAAGYDYSPALKASSLTWNTTTLDRWLANPEKLVPGQKMGVAITDAKERRDLIAYLRVAAK